MFTLVAMPKTWWIPLTDTLPGCSLGLEPFTRLAQQNEMPLMPPCKWTFKVDGGCRNNGRANAYGAAACCMMGQSTYEYKTQRLPSYPVPTNQRAELLAIILALEWALEEQQNVWQRNGAFTLIDVEIKADSRYAYNCLTVWLPTWQRNGWMNSHREPVVNRDLIEKAVDLERQVLQGGSVTYTWVPREENVEADRHCNEAMDEQIRPSHYLY